MIGGIAAGLLIPAVQSTRDAARRMQNTNNLRMLALAMHFSHDRNRRLPPAYTEKDGKRLHSWRVLILPYLEEQELYNQIHLDEPWDSEWNKQFHDKCPKVFQNPAVQLAPDETTYAVVVGNETMFPGAKKSTLESAKDGTSFTGMITERTPVCWMDPNSDIPFEEAIKGVGESEVGIQSYFNGTFTAVMADGSVLSLPSNVTGSFLEKLFNKADGNSIDFDNPELEDEE